MELFADRFLRGSSSQALDLASGRRVVLREFRAAEAFRLAQWAARCAARGQTRREARPALVDFGTCAGERCFEAYAVCGDVEARGGPPAPSPIVRVTIQPREALRELAALLDDPGGSLGGVRIVALRGGRGSGRSTLLAQLAREARLRGYVPVSTPLLAAFAGSAMVPALPPGLRDEGHRLLAGRHLLVLDDDSAETAAERLARLVVQLGAAGPSAHLVITTGRGRGACCTVDMDPLSVPQLMAVARVHRRYGARVAFATASAARLAEGAPGLFLDRLRRTLLAPGRGVGRRRNATEAARPAIVQAAAVAEEAAEYRVVARQSGPVGGEGPPGPSPARAAAAAGAALAA
ncbi:MAG: hypothetical protein KGN76_18245, partial [Acidobacteriota bacterium]|nr:hypothetical protein [Acidobacteriota bacterium]